MSTLLGGYVILNLRVRRQIFVWWEGFSNIRKHIRINFQRGAGWCVSFQRPRRHSHGRFMAFWKSITLWYSEHSEVEHVEADVKSPDKQNHDGDDAGRLGKMGRGGGGFQCPASYVIVEDVGGMVPPCYVVVYADRNREMLDNKTHQQHEGSDRPIIRITASVNVGPRVISILSYHSIHAIGAASNDSVCL